MAAVFAVGENLEHGSDYFQVQVAWVGPVHGYSTVRVEGAKKAKA